MGLGGGPREADEYEWVRLPDLVLPREPRRRAGRRQPRDAVARAATRSASRADTRSATRAATRVVTRVVADQPLEPMALALTRWLERHPLWVDGGGARVLLADLDNLRADPLRWRARMAAVVALARQADHWLLAGQGGAVARARPHLAEFAARARPVPDGSDVADHELLRAAAAVRAARVQVVVVSNDGIFADLAERGPLVVLSPGRAALSARLADAATRVVDLPDLEERAQLGAAAR